jgi:hypothetical protein
MRNIAISLDDLWMMVLSTVRYSMGRRSYIVGWCCDDLLKHYCEYLLDHQIVQIADEIERELRFCEARGETLGTEIDHRRWKEATQWLKEQIELREQEVICKK